MALEVQIRKQLNNFTLNVSFKAGEGIFALLGGPGTGKSQTLRCIAGVSAPDEGRIVLDGKVLFDSISRVSLPPGRRRVGYLFRDFALFPEMTVDENIRMALSGGGRQEVRKKAAGGGKSTAIEGLTRDFLHEYHLDGLGGYYPEELSAGQKVRAAMARMMAADPALVLLDEPFSLLDSYQKAEILREVRDKLEEKKIPAVFASHDRDEVYAMSRNVCVLCDGESRPAMEKAAFFHHPRTVAGALLSGCRNVASIRRLNESHAVIPDWGLILTKSRESGEDLPGPVWENASALELKEKKKTEKPQNEAAGRKEREIVPPKDAFSLVGFQKAGGKEEKAERKTMPAPVPEEADAVCIPEGALRREKPSSGSFLTILVHDGKIEETPEGYDLYFRPCPGPGKKMIFRISKALCTKEELAQVRRLYVKSEDILWLSER